MPTVRRIGRQILFVKVQQHLLHFEAKLLVQTDRVRIGRGHMQRNVFAHARLRQMVQHEGGQTGALPTGPNGHERHVRIVVADVRHQKRAANQQAFVQRHDAELRIRQTFGHCALNVEKTDILIRVMVPEAM